MTCLAAEGTFRTIGSRPLLWLTVAGLISVAATNFAATNFAATNAAATNAAAADGSGEELAVRDALELWLDAGQIDSTTLRPLALE